MVVLVKAGVIKLFPEKTGVPPLELANQLSVPPPVALRLTEDGEEQDDADVTVGVDTTLITKELTC